MVGGGREQKKKLCYHNDVKLSIRGGEGWVHGQQPHILHSEAEQERYFFFIVPVIFHLYMCYVSGKKKKKSRINNKELYPLFLLMATPQYIKKDITSVQKDIVFK